MSEASEKSERLSRLYAALNETNEVILHAKSPQALYQGVCEAAVNGGRFRITTVLLKKEGTKWMKVVGVAGPEKRYMRESIRLSMDAEIPEGRGQTGIAFRTQEVCMTNDLMGDPRNRPWHEHARKVGVLAAASVPIIRKGASIGVLNFYAAEKNAFDNDVVALFKRMAENVSFALDALEHRAERTRAELELRRFRSLAAQESA